EVQEQRSEKNQAGVVEKRYSQIEIAIAANGRVEHKHEGSKTERREVKNKRRASSLFEEDKKADQQENYTYQVDVDNSRRPFMKRAEMIQVGPVSTRIGSVRRPLHQVMDLAVETCLIEVNLHVASGGDLFGPGVVVESDADQDVVGSHPCPLGRRTMLDAVSFDSGFRINPLDTIPRRCFVFESLAEVEEAGADQ